MGTINRKKKFNCFNDCTISGCKGHELEIEVQTTADIMEVKVDGHTLFMTDPSKWEAILESVDSLDYEFFKAKH